MSPLAPPPTECRSCCHAPTRCFALDGSTAIHGSTSAFTYVRSPWRSGASQSAYGLGPETGTGDEPARAGTATDVVTTRATVALVANALSFGTCIRIGVYHPGIDERDLDGRERTARARKGRGAGEPAGSPARWTAPPGWISPPARSSDPAPSPRPACPSGSRPCRRSGSGYPGTRVRRSRP